MGLLYQLALGAAAVLVAPWLWLRRPRHYGRTIVRRWWGETPAPNLENDRAPLWLHAVSVGEVAVAATLASVLPESLPLLVTTVTPTGQERARASLGDRATVTYLPFDFGFPIRRFFARYQPRALVLIEGDYWPLLLHHAARRRVPIIVVSGRISDRSFARLRRLGGLVQPLLRPVARFGVQGTTDRDRLLALGVPTDRVLVTGNLKFEGTTKPIDPGLREALLAAAAGRPILVAGSTMPGEEELIARVQRTVSSERAMFVVAPRHPERFRQAEEVLRHTGARVVRRSALTADAATPCDVVVLDTLGELAGVYALARGTFVGGTLVPSGGHNPLEPARFGVAIAVGPSMSNFQDIATAFDEAEAWQRVRDADELAATFDRWCGSQASADQVGQRAATLLARHRGAAARSLELLRPYLS